MKTANKKVTAERLVRDALEKAEFFRDYNILSRARQRDRMIFDSFRRYFSLSDESCKAETFPTSSDSSIQDAAYPSIDAEKTLCYHELVIN